MSDRETDDPNDPYDPYCQRFAEEIPSVASWSDLDGYENPGDWVKGEEGTYNPENGHFACDECYIELGTPSGRTQRWVAE